MPLSSGTKLGPYEVIAPVGSGGMGEVYRARDTRLDRSIAIKVLPQHLSSNPDLKQRFEREARAISTLNHPRICTLHDVGHQDGVDYLVMEFLEGETLAQRLKKGPLPLRETLRVGIEVCEALDKAHRAGIVHRDLKPGNVMLTRNGAKLMDFGLAKAIAASMGPVTTSAPLFSAAKTMSEPSPISPLTTAGSVIGTIQYMAPEQIEGKEADARSDIFALGAVLYEMLTGKRAFEGESQISVASAILEKEPRSISSVQPLTPPALEHLVKNCLAKNPDDRFQTAHDVSLQLKWIGESAGQATIVAGAKDPNVKKKPAWITALPWALCGLLVAALAASVLLSRAGKSAEAKQYFSISLPFPANDLAFAPNGHTLAATGILPSERTSALWLYEVGEQQAHRLPDTNGAAFPFWSPDGKSLAFFADGKLKKFDLAGGPVQTICDAPSGRGGSWNQGGAIILTPNGGLSEGLYRVPATGGTPTRITLPDSGRGEDSNRWPIFLPDGRHFLYFAGNIAGQTDPDAYFVGALDSNQKTFVTKGIGNSAYVPSGYLVFYSDKTLFAQAFDAGNVKLSGEAVPLLTDVAYTPRIARASFAASEKYVIAQRGYGVPLAHLIWYDRKGNEVGVAGKADTYANVSLAPNGKSLVLDKTDEGNQNTDVWTYDLQRDALKRLTFDPSVDSTALFSPDGSQVIFASSREHVFRMFIKNADGATEEEVVPLDNSDRSNQYPSDWARDGKFIIFLRANELWVAEMPSLKARPLVQGTSTAKNGRFSPDGKWVAYESNESGRWEIYVTSFPDQRGKWQVSTAGGIQPRWRGDSKELFYIAADGKMMAIPVTGGSNFDFGGAVALFDAHARERVATSEQAMYDVSRDGQRFLINTPIKTDEVHPLTVILNWQAEFKK